MPADVLLFPGGSPPGDITLRDPNEGASGDIAGIAYMICTASGSLGAHVGILIVVNASFGRRVIVGGAAGVH